MNEAVEIIRVLVIASDPARSERLEEILTAKDSTGDLEAEAAELFREFPSAEDAVDFEIASATQGEDGLEMARAAMASDRPFAVAFIDAHLPPGWDGVQTTRALWRECPDLQVVLCSTGGEDTWRATVRRLGVSDRLLILRQPCDEIEALQTAHALGRKWLLSRALRGQLESLEARVVIRTAELERANGQLRTEVAERNAALEALRAAEERFALAFGASPVAMLMEAAADGRFVEINAAGVALLGRAREAIIGHRAEELGLWVDADQQTEVRLLVQAGEPVRHFAAQWRDGGGAVRQVQLWSERLAWRGRDHLLLMAADVTELANLEAQLRQAQKMEAVGSLAAGVAHEFNNILGVIHGHLSVQLDGKGLRGDTRAALSAAFSASERAAALTRRLLTCTRQQVIAREPLDLVAVLEETRSLLARTLGEQIAQQWELGEAQPVVAGEAAAIEQIVLNLALNARDAMPDGGALIVRLEVVAINATTRPQARPGEYARLSVIDHGCGIAPENLPRIFEPFFTTKSPGAGTGLGLAVVYAIVEKLGGWIEVGSAPGEGATFRVYLPISATARPEDSAAPSARPAAESATILIVDDEEMLIYLLQGILTMCGHRVITAPDATSAMQRWAEHHGEIDLVITDMVMPGGVSGRDLSEMLLTESPGLPIIFTSGYSPDFAGANLTLTPGVNFLPKPYTSQAVLEIVERMLAGRRDRG